MKRYYRKTPMRFVYAIQLFRSYVRTRGWYPRIFPIDPITGEEQTGYNNLIFGQRLNHSSVIFFTTLTQDTLLLNYEKNISQVNE